MQLSITSSDDLRKNLDGAKGIVSVDSAIYAYLNGDLLSVSWNAENAILSLSSDNWANYPAGSDTFAGKLLTHSQVSVALNALPDSVYQKPAQ